MAEEAEERARLRSHPTFAEMAGAAARNIGGHYRGDVLLTRMLNDRGRITLALLMLSMDLESDPGAPGLTSGRLKTEAVALGLCSPGRVTAILAACRLLGLVAPAPDADRRRHRLVVTPRLMEIHKERWRAMLGAMGPALPEGGRALAHLDDPRFLEAFVTTLLAPLRAGWRIVTDVPCLELFADRDGGLMVAFCLFDAANGQTPLSVAHLARECRISRSHVMDMLRAAAEAGLVRRLAGRGSAEGGVIAEPALIAAMETLLAAALVRQARAARAGLAAVGQAEMA
ncbi:MarR family transcriptional regulator [Ancylobacter sp. VKM B-3255]|uniref:MarR family transcriptional regulator n=1 Tax=Ancylobacter radicis TaxID=2836179 RepID=A0ABS5R6T0_9HYPH|nr:MarR family transcriptional regulator [Ancylobacter radicis]